MLEVQSIEPDSIWAKTNPVWCYNEFLRRQNAKHVNPRKTQSGLASWIEQAQDLGVRFPSNLWEELFCFVASPHWEKPAERPRVIGVLRSRGSGSNEPTGFVTQVRAKSSSLWSVTDGLPFKVGHIQDAFSKLIQIPGSSLEMIVPEAKPFEISDSLGQTPTGSSINIAGLLAVIDAWNGFKGTDLGDPLRCACAIVKPSGKALVPVGGICEKLDAFHRECGFGSMVVCATRTAQQFDLQKRFTLVWRVEDFESLARWLSDAGLLRVVLEQRPLTIQYVAEAARILTKLRSTEGPKVALDFSRRLGRAAEQGGVESLRVKQRVNETLEDFNRHIGNFSEAVKHSERALQAQQSIGDKSSFQEEVEVKVRLASAMYDAHQLEEAKKILEDLLRQYKSSPRVLNAEARVMLFNTLARLLVVTGADGWEPLYRASIELQRDFEPSSIGRTRCYLTHGLLRARNRSAEVQKELSWFDEHEVDPYTKSFVKFYRAELYRQNPSCGLAFRQDEDFEKGGKNHPYGFYLQATARQPGRDPDDRKERFEKAIMVFANEIGGYTHQNILHLVSHFIGLETGVTGVPPLSTPVQRLDNQS